MSKGGDQFKIRLLLLSSETQSIRGGSIAIESIGINETIIKPNTYSHFDIIQFAILQPLTRRYKSRNGNDIFNNVFYMSCQRYVFIILRFAMRDLKQLLLITITVLSSQLGMTQYAWDVGGNLGFANYLGEIGGGAGQARDWVLDMKLSQTRWNPGFFVRYRADYNLGINMSLNYFRIQGADSLTENPNRFTRNLHFRNDVFELAACGEYYFFNQPDVGRTGRYLLDFKAYIFAGGALFYNNPKAQYQGKWVALQPLMTEGQEDKYSRIQFAIPVGFGFFYTFSRLHRFGWSIAWRYTFTDYIDDVSGYYPDPADLESAEARALSNRTYEVENHPLAAGIADSYSEGGVRGNPDANDSYLLTSFNYSYVIRGSTKSFGKRKNYLYGRKRGRAGRARF